MDQERVARLGRGAAMLGFVVQVLLIAAIASPRWSTFDQASDVHFGLWKVCTDDNCQRISCTDYWDDDDGWNTDNCGSLQLVRGNMFISLAMAFCATMISLSVARRYGTRSIYAGSLCYAVAFGTCVWALIDWSFFTADIAMDNDLETTSGQSTTRMLLHADGHARGGDIVAFVSKHLSASICQQAFRLNCSHHCGIQT
eukprot:TRINITY_DN7565_c0_g1_i2.p2 TRINITY_DN7565_c0_g1~~TRINITY_DN7565_c0_g1_i2.p2  ORF type:complete len:212 (+),score=38.80 TRINITY_DN7565_c0_g1_i2:40-636(+)